MTLRVPVTASIMPEWVRLAAGAINSLIGRSDGYAANVAALQAADTALQAADTAQNAATTALDTRIGALETAAPIPVVTTITFTPVALPGSPVIGQTVYDEADGIVKTWDGTAWQAHY